MLYTRKIGEISIFMQWLLLKSSIECKNVNFKNQMNEYQA